MTELRVTDTAGNHQFAIVDDNTGQDIAIVYNRNEESKKIAQLLAAAPELFAECLRADDELSSALRDGASHLTEEMMRKWLRGVRDAINKATQP